MTAPRMPGHTCPMIDKLKKRIETAYDLADSINNAHNDDISGDDLRELLRNIRYELHNEADALEKIRDANLALRNCAEYWEEKATEQSA